MKFFPSSKPTSSNFLKNKEVVYNSASNNLNKISENIEEKEFIIKNLSDKKSDSRSAAAASHEGSQMLEAKMT